MKIGIIGCGGIGSFFIRELYQLFENSVQGTEDIEVTMIDNDEVEEKNLRYQNFQIEDLGDKKAESLNKRYAFLPLVKQIETEEDLNEFDIIILAVDNGKTRNLVYEHCDKTYAFFIDLRSEGRAVTFFTKHENNTLEELKKTINVDAPSTSCQLKYELDAGIIQIGNRIIANIGVQLLLNHLRGEKLPAKFIQRF